MTKILVTGGCGFIGSNFIRKLLLTETLQGIKIINFDALTYAANRDNLKDLEGRSDYEFILGDISKYSEVEKCFQLHSDISRVIHFAAESHVDRSLHDSSPFILTNVLGTQVLLDVSRKYKIKRFLYVGTDEVYGALTPDQEPVNEEGPLRPNSPYAASKTAAEHFVRAAWKSFGLPVIISRCSNNYGPYQFPEKLIPLMIINALEDKPLPVYGDGKQIRDWIHVDEHVRALFLLLYGSIEDGSIWNIGGNCEKTNLEVIELILKILNKSQDLITFVKDRPGHDRRYAIDDKKLRDTFGLWRATVPAMSFEEGLLETVNWYIENKEWWERVRSGAYRQYYEKHYGQSL